MFRTFVIFLILLCSGGVSAKERALARIVAVGQTQGLMTEVTLKIESGAFFSGSDIELLAPNFKLVAKLKLPSGIDMALKGDEVKRVMLVLKEAKPVAGFIAEPGQFANHESARQSLTSNNAAVPAAAAATAAATTKPVTTTVAEPALANASACPYTAQELNVALGMKLNAGKGNATPFPGGVSYSCTFDSSTDFAKVYINQIVMPRNALTPNSIDGGKRNAGKMTPITGDVDRAEWQTDQGDFSGVVLHYTRGGAMVEIRVMPGASFMGTAQK